MANKEISALTAAATLDGTELVHVKQGANSRRTTLQAIANLASASVTAWKQVVRVATVSAGTLASSFEAGDTVDGVTLAAGDRILIKDQVAGAENGIYIVEASGSPTRASDANTGSELVGALVPVSEGTSNADRIFQCTTNATITLGSTSLTFAQFRGAPFRGAMVKKAADQTGANYSAGVAIAWDGEVYDTDSIHDNVTNNTRLTVPAGVSYVRVGCNLSLAAVTTDVVITLDILKNGVSSFDGATGDKSSTGTTIPLLSLSSGPVPVSASDYFEARLTTGDTSITVTAAASNFWLEIID